MQVSINSFYFKSLTLPGATSSYFTPNEIREKVEANLHLKKPGDKPGTWLVPLNGEGFKSPTLDLSKLTTVEQNWMTGTFEARREGEDRFIELSFPGAEKAPAETAQAVLYEVATLKADHEREGGDPRDFYEEGDHDYEIVIVKAPADEPGGLSMMVRNQKSLQGGTPASYSSEEWCNAVHFWLTHVKVG